MSCPPPAAKPTTHGPGWVGLRRREARAPAAKPRRWQDKINDDAQGASHSPRNVLADVARLLHRLPGWAEGHDRATSVLPAAPLGRSLSDGGRPSGEASSTQFFRWPVLQVASPARFRDEGLSRGSAVARGRLTGSQAKRAADVAHTIMVRHMRSSAVPPVLKNDDGRNDP